MMMNCLPTGLTNITDPDLYRLLLDGFHTRRLTNVTWFYPGSISCLDAGLIILHLSYSGLFTFSGFFSGTVY